MRSSALLCAIAILLLGARALAAPCTIEGAKPGFIAVDRASADVNDLATSALDEWLKEVAAEPNLACELVWEKASVSVLNSCVTEVSGYEFIERTLARNKYARHCSKAVCCPLFPILGPSRGLCQRSCAVKQALHTQGKAGLVGSVAAPGDAFA
jgi:hypothetical protein